MKDLITKYVMGKINDYLGFDFDSIYEDMDIDYAYIFGGAIRNSMIDAEINDVDILCMPRSKNNLEKILKKNGYIFCQGYTKIDLASLYSDIKVIHTPLTYIKGDKKVQLIRPMRKSINKSDLYLDFFSVLCNVDLTPSGVYYDGVKVKSSIPGSKYDIFYKVYSVNKNATMFNEKRLDMRIAKIELLGFIEEDDFDYEKVQKHKMKSLKENALYQKLVRHNKMNKIINKI
jgi:hypothetical protein